jgi:Sulfatase-modifying factor enzyme 1
MIETGRDWEWSLEGGSTRSLLLKWIQPGSFLMGSPATEAGRNPDERQFRSTFTHGFWIGAYLITQGQYAALMGVNPSRFCSDDNRPVECVSWDDALACCERLNVSLRSELPAGYHFTLPSESQWEYCCRAGTTTPYMCGESAQCLNEFAWHGGNGNGETQPVSTVMHPTRQMKLSTGWAPHPRSGSLIGAGILPERSLRCCARLIGDTQVVAFAGLGLASALR